VGVNWFRQGEIAETAAGKATDLIRALQVNANDDAYAVRLTLPILAAAITTLQDAGELSADPTWAELHELSERARIPEKMPFGKHVGQPLKEVPHSYIRWALDNITDMDVYLRKGFTAILNGEDL